MHDVCGPLRLARHLGGQIRSPPYSLTSLVLSPRTVWVQPYTSYLRSSVLAAQPSRAASSSSSTRWKSRQTNDKFTKEARTQGLMSRAAFKLLEINEKHRLFKQGQTVVDLGFAPGSWSQVAADRTKPGGRVIGIDVIPALPPKGVSTIQGNFLSESVQQQVMQFVRDPSKGRSVEQKFMSSDEEEVTEDDLGRASTRVLNHFAKTASAADQVEAAEDGSAEDAATRRSADEKSGRVVDVVLSDMSAPWVQEIAWGKNSLNDPYFRMMNTSGNTFRDHVGSMDLCNAALRFAFETLRTGGSFVCKFYAGGEDKLFEKRLKLLFSKVHRDKPSSSRSASKEAYFIGLRRKPDADRDAVLSEPQ